MNDGPPDTSASLGSESHFEIFKLEARRWTFHGTAPAAEEAIEVAQKLRDSGTRAVKVTRKEFNTGSGAFKRRTIFLDGDTQSRKGDEGPPEDEEPSPFFCWKVEDFYSLPGRMMIAQFLRDALDRWNVTPTELIHHAGHVDRLQATGTLMQQAVQRLAIQQVQNTDKRVTLRIKELHELVGVASRRLFDMDRKGTLPCFEPGALDALLHRIDGDPNRLFLFNAAIARRLEDAASWREKLRRCLIMLEEPGIAPGQRSFVAQAVDSIVAELLAGRFRIDALLGCDGDMVGALDRAGALFVGSLTQEWQDIPADLRALDRAIAERRFSQSRRAIARRILAEVDDPKKRTDGDLKAEMTFFTRLSLLFERTTGNLMGLDEIRRAFTNRIERLLTASHVGDYLEGATTPFDRIERLLDLAPAVIGLANKRRLAGFIGPMMTGNDAEMHMAPSDARAPMAMRRLVAIQRRLEESDLDPEDISRFAATLDRLCVTTMERSALLKRVLAPPGDPIERAFRILKLCAGQQFTRGKASETAHRLALELLAQPGALNAYLEAGGPEERVSRLKAVRSGLSAAGVRGGI